MKESTQFTEMEMDLIGEVMNICIGAGVAKLTSILDKKVNIVQVSASEDINFSDGDLGAIIDYHGGIEGRCIMVFKQDDLKTISALISSYHEKDIINKVMRESTQALSAFLDVPISAVINNTVSPIMISETLHTENYVTVRFNIIIDEVLDGHIYFIMDKACAGELIAASMGSRDLVKQVSHEGQKRQVVPYSYKRLETEASDEALAHESNMDLIMSVPVQITVVLGSTKKRIKEIAEYTVGNIIELNRQAGDHVDIVANGRLIAKGEVVVVDDNYSVRITEIMKARDSLSDI
jgi:flagellar motor switch protein FliN/FliY